jgi:hypothetical protein
MAFGHPEAIVRFRLLGIWEAVFPSKLGATNYPIPRISSKRANRTNQESFAIRNAIRPLAPGFHDLWLR